MPSTYTNNGGLQKPGTGEQSGTWGDTVNANSDIIDRLTNGVLTLSLTGTSSTLTTADGVLSDGQYMMLVLSGSPSGTHTITLSPNDAQKIYFVYNSTAQQVVVTQGSGGNATIPVGGSKIIYANGAGATAAVADFTTHLSMASVEITGGSIAGITDLAVADGGTGVSTLTGIVKGNGASAFTAAVAGTDYLAPAAIGVTVQAWGAKLDQIAALAPTDNNFIVGNGTAWALETPAQALTSLGVTSTAAQLNYLNTATSDIQTQLNAKIATSSIATVANFRANTVDKTLDTDSVWEASAEVALTDGASIALDMSTGINFAVTLAGNRALANPTNTKVGQSGYIRVSQDATGSRTLSFGTSYKFVSGVAPTLTTTASAEDYLFYQVASSTKIIVSFAGDVK